MTCTLAPIKLTKLIKETQKKENLNPTTNRNPTYKIKTSMIKYNYRESQETFIELNYKSICRIISLLNFKMHL